MTTYSYFPGCSLKGTGRAYEESLLPVMKALDIELEELDDMAAGYTDRRRDGERDPRSLAPLRGRRKVAEQLARDDERGEQRPRYRGLWGRAAP